MCGIVGFTGAAQAAPILLDGLAKLEYRGYDSAGMAVQNAAGKIEVVKAKGRLKVLSEMTDGGSAVLNGPPEVEEGGSRILTVTPDEGYTLTMITVNGLERTADAEGRLALDGILEDMTIEIAFERESGSNAVYYIMIAAIVLVFAAAGYFFYRKRA